MATCNLDEEEALLLLLLQQRQKVGRAWVHELITTREKEGEYHTLMPILRRDETKFFTYFRMTFDKFDALVEMLTPDIEKINMNMRKSISVEHRLMVCLRFLSTGDSFTTIATSFRLGISTVGEIVEEVCEALWWGLLEEFLPLPNTEQQWLDIASKFEQTWQFANCIGALDGKHCVIQAPPNSGSLFFNHKGSFSLVLMALVDADARFLIVDIGSYGGNSDGGILKDGKLGQVLAANKLNIPGPKTLPGAPEIEPLTHVILADAAFPLKSYLMKPYPGRHLPEDRDIFNYRLSRARRISENAFGILCQRWRLYHRKLNLHPSRALKVIQATVVLHNYLQRVNAPGQNNVNQDVNTDEMRGLEGLQANEIAGNRPTKDAEIIRDKFKEYFMSPAGEVAWQYDRVRREH